MFTDYRDKNTLIAELFLDFGKNINTNKEVIANYCSNLSHIDYEELKNIIDNIRSNSDKMPKWMDINNLYNSQTILKGHESVECGDCNRSGVIYAIKCGDNMIMSLNYPNHNKDFYYSVVIGRCGCENGEKYYKSMPVAKTPKFILDFSKEIDDYPNASASDLVIKLNKNK